MARTVELRWIPDFRAYAVRLGARLVGFVACDAQLPFASGTKVRYA